MRLREEEVIPAQPVIAQIGGERHQMAKEEHLMMVYEYEGMQCITFAAKSGNGPLIPGPFPQHLLECDECMQDLADGFDEQGYVLTREEEQTIRTS